jgi:hypothetical protein
MREPIQIDDIHLVDFSSPLFTCIQQRQLVWSPLRASNDINAPSKLARSLSKDGS